MKPPFSRGTAPGFTLVELLIALAVSGILILVLTKFYSLTLRSYTLQEQITEMNQNAKFVMKEVSEVLQQAGADCLATGNSATDRDTIVKLTGSGPAYNEFTIKVNPRGGIATIDSLLAINTASPCTIRVDDASVFTHANKLGRIPKAGAVDSVVKIYDLLEANSATNKIIISGGKAKDTFAVSDAIYSFVNYRYYLSGTNLCLNSDTVVLAENIDLFRIVFYNLDGDSTLTSAPPWKTMRAASLQVEATTSGTDPKYPGDHRRRLKLFNQFRLKNKVGRTS
jgi:prepilin-type N-terminal cleavage/methylation domain-containing protein